MILDELVLEVWDGLGRPTDISPLDELDDNSTINSTLTGYQQLQRWVNQGYEAISKWRTSSGKFYRHRDTIKRKFCQYGPHLLIGPWDEYNPGDPAFTPKKTFIFPNDLYYENLVPPDLVWVTFQNLGTELTYAEVDPPVVDYITSPTIAGIDDVYQNVYQVSGADYASLAYFQDAHTLYFLDDLPWIIPETEITVYEKGIYIGRFNQPHGQALDDLYAIRQVRVFDAQTKKDALLASRTENFTQNYSELGWPTQYYREKQYLYFDWHVPQELTYQIEYIEQITKLTSGSQAPVIQERFHPCIVYWALYRGLLRFGEQTDAYSMFRFLDNEMKTIVKEDDLDIDREEGHFVARARG
jgi:hypothetical protein